MPPKYLRRALSIPAVILFMILYVGLLPIWLPLVALVDVVVGPKRLRFLRLAYVLFLLAVNELVVVFLLGVTWLRAGIGTRVWSDRSQHRFQKVLFRYINGLMTASERALGLRYEITGLHESLDAGGPLLVFGHHTSLIDSALPAYVLFKHSGWQIRYVIKKTLAYAPAFDIGGHLLPIHFVDRTGKKTTDELASLSQLTKDLDAESAAVIFPEGTFYNAKRLAKSVERLQTDAPHLVSRAQQLSYTLPPRAGGVLAMVKGAPDADVLFVGHAGLERFTSLKNIIRNVPLREPIRVHCWRVKASDVPRESAAIYDWVFGEFEKMDHWIAEQLHPNTAKAA